MPRIALVFVVSRLLLLAVAVAVELTQPGLVPPEHLVTDDRDIWQTLTAWDGVWYRSIAETGYHAEFDRWPDYVFYPLYPMAIRVMSLVVGDWSLAALLVSNGAFALALVVLYALSCRYLERERAMFSLWLLALAPGSFAFGLAYTESLFLLLAVGAFVAAEQRRHWLVGVMLVLSTLTRPTGILLLLPLVVLYMQRDGWRPTRAWLPLGLAPLAFLGWHTYLWWLTGDPMATGHAQYAWDLVAAQAPEGEGATLPLPQMPVIAIYFGMIALYTFSLVYIRPRRFPWAYRLVVVVLVGSLFMSGRLESAARYLAIAWPAYWGFATRDSRLGRMLVLVVFAALQVVLLWYIFTWNSLP